MHENENGCWIWENACSGTGYPIMQDGNKRQMQVSRVLFAEKFGRPPSGPLKRRCHNKKCVNPDHAYKNIHDVFLSKTEIVGDCWAWRGDLSVYGMYQGKRAHRYSYEEYNGPIGGGLEVRHTCNHAGCVNPSHLILGTHAENMKDMCKDKLTTMTFMV